MINYVRQTQMHTVEPLVLNLVFFDVEIAIVKLKGYISPGIDLIPVELIQTEDIHYVMRSTNLLILGLTQPPIQWAPRALSLGVKRPGSRADHSLPSSAEVKYASSWHGA